MYRVVYHLDAVLDLDSVPKSAARSMVEKTEERLQEHCEPDGRVIKRLKYITVAVFFEYKVRFDWRAIFYIDHQHREVRVLGFVPKNIGSALFDKRLEWFFHKRFGSFF